MLVSLWTGAAEGQIERYGRKSVSLFRLKIPEDMTAGQGRIIFDTLQNQLRSMGRFDINPIPLKPGIRLEKVFAIAKEYAESEQLDRARKQFELMDEHYKEERITGETLDRIIEGAYVIVPEVVKFSISRDVKKHTDKEGKEYWKGKVKVSYGLKLEVWNAENLGSRENPIWEPKLEDEAVISTIGSESKTFSKKPKRRDALIRQVDEAVENSLFLLKLQMGKTLKSFEMFTIKAKVTDRNLSRDLVKFDFGEDVGLHRDDPFKVVYYERTGEGERKKVDLAYMKVREVAERESRAQVLILYNPERIKESDLINPGDQVIEHPKIGLNISLRAGYAAYSLSAGMEDYWMHYSDSGDVVYGDNYYFETDQDEISGAPALMLRAELGLAQFGAPSELYLVNDYTFLMNLPMMGAIGELGVKKRFYKRRLGGFVGANVGAMFVFGNIGEVPRGQSGTTTMYQRRNDPSSAKIPMGSNVYLTGWTMGVNLTGGFEYLISPEMALSFEGGYRLYAPIEGDRWRVEARDGDESWEMEIDEFSTKPGPADITGAWFALGVILSL